MKPNGAFHFTAPPEQVTERQMRLNRVAISELQKDLDRLVRLFVKEIVESTKITRAEFANPFATRTLAAASRGKPAGHGRDWQQQPKQVQQIGHDLDFAELGGRSWVSGVPGLLEFAARGAQPRTHACDHTQIYDDAAQRHARQQKQHQ